MSLLIVSSARAALVALLLCACHRAAVAAAEGLRVWEPPSEVVRAPEGGLVLALEDEGASEKSEVLVFSWRDAETDVDASELYEYTVAGF